MTNLYGENHVSSEKDVCEAQAPLAWRMRPRDLSEFMGQSHLLGPGKLLRRAIDTGRVSSLLLYGPPGCGKTALAHIIAHQTQAQFKEINAVTAGVQEIRQILQEARQGKSLLKRGMLVFVDEIHRFNKAQQSALLPDIERGTVILIGASTQNPSFAVVAALSSRSQIFELRPLEEADLKLILTRALTDPERGMGRFNVVMALEALDHLVKSCGGDARRALNALELGVLTTPPNARGEIQFDLKVAQESVGKKALVYEEDAHYDTISAFIKSIRGSDPDATLYWLAKMLYAGEDPLYIARRLIICAAEDVGNADPWALQMAVAALHALEVIGMPEGQIPLAQTALYVASAPKSNAAYQAIAKALEHVETHPVQPVPPHLQDAHYPGAARLGRGEGYRYPHDYPGHFVEQDYLTERLSFYQPSEEGHERKIKRRLKKLRKDKKSVVPHQG
jgi:putative ATPase